MRVSREISLGSSLHRASTDALIQALSHSYTSSYSCVCRICFILIGGSSKYVYKWKNHFYEMKGDVGMSLHEKERNKKMPTPRYKVTHNPIPTSLFCFNMLFVCLL